MIVNRNSPYIVYDKKIPPALTLEVLSSKSSSADSSLDLALTPSNKTVFRPSLSTLFQRDF